MNIYKKKIPPDHDFKCLHTNRTEYSILQFHIGLSIPTEHRHMKSTSRLELATPAREITLPARVGYNQENQFVADIRKTISQLQETKWDAGYNLMVLNRKVCRAKANGISNEKGWYYL
ncbi:hypothetical protein MKX03_017106 [Papaver bracteatum]|nr:hypothetical protein MKX03_017106 [Papaver bracteatum]